MQAAKPLPEAVPAPRLPAISMIQAERWFIGLHILVALSALSVGIILGPFQAFRRAPALQWDMPIFSYYYQALTAHGVLNALVFTTFFIMGISYFVTQRSLARPLRSMRLAWTAFVMMTVGMLLAGFAIVTGQANVLYTFYPPLVAHWTFYVGLTLVVLGTWVGALVVFMTYVAWKKDHPGERVPLAVYAVLANFIMWVVASTGVAIEILTMLLPLSLGIITTTDAQVARILFWFFGHPLVYFWLIPAYLSWYTMLPKQLGVQLFSDGMGRIAFLMIMIFSIPIGVHHLFVDPGVSEVAKVFHSLLTFVVAIPSFLTAFNIAATLERGGRRRGARGRFFHLDFFFHLPWGDPIIVSQLGGMVLFIFGGVTGVMNASFNLNVALHNTTWVVGHFHTTVAGAVFMTYISILYWILPMIRGRKLYRPRLALAQAYLWGVGMVLFGWSMGRAGIEGAVRRTDAGAAGAYLSEAAGSWLNVTAIAGSLLLLSAVLLYVVVLGTLFLSKEPAEETAPIATEAPRNDPSPLIFERWGIWMSVIIISCIIMWGPVLLEGLDFINGFWARGVTPP